MKILLVEDDIQLNTTIESYLQFQNYEVVTLLDGDNAFDYIDTVQFDLYIIDINLPNINGLDLVKYIRNKDLFSPIIMITASLELENLKVAYKNGCNEYIKKPFHLDELNIRINNLLDKEAIKEISIFPNGSYDLEYEELKIDNKIVKLRKKERRLLTVLLNNINHTVTYEMIENYVWENEIREKYPLRQLVGELKNNFGNFGHIVESERGKGYRIVAQSS